MRNSLFTTLFNTKNHIRHQKTSSYVKNRISYVKYALFVKLYVLNLPIKRFRRTFAASKYDFYGRVIEDYDDQNRLVSWPIFTATGGTHIQTNFLKYDDNNNIVRRSAFGDCAIHTPISARWSE